MICFYFDNERIDFMSEHVGISVNNLNIVANFSDDFAKVLLPLLWCDDDKVLRMNVSQVKALYDVSCKVISMDWEKESEYFYIENYHLGIVDSFIKLRDFCLRALEMKKGLVVADIDLEFVR